MHEKTIQNRNRGHGEMALIPGPAALAKRVALCEKTRKGEGPDRCRSWASSLVGAGGTGQGDGLATTAAAAAATAAATVTQRSRWRWVQA